MPPPTDQARWLSAEVDPHRGALRAYVQRAFPGVRDVDDVVQDSLLRIWTDLAGWPNDPSERGLTLRFGAMLGTGPL
jgi:DNA-directed RNA polymerase specialized sigma24 family protein